MQRVVLSGVVIASIMLSGCLGNSPKTFSEKYHNYIKNVPDLDDKDVETFAKDNEKILADFAKLAGVKTPGANEEWRPVIDAGINYTDTRCDRFMDALFWLNRARETTSRQLEYTGSAVGAALAVVEASKTAIGLTPLGFSLFDQTVNNLTTGLLYNLSPSTVRILVEKRQTAYIQALTPSYTSRAIALRVIQGYAAICLPPAIEAEVERAINAKEYVPNPTIAVAATSPDDKEPNPFAFADVVSAVAGADVESGVIVVTGIGSPAPISIEDGKYQLVGSAAGYTDQAGSVQSGQKIQVKVTAPSADGASSAATLTIGGTPATFTVRTKIAAPDAGTRSIAPVKTASELGEAKALAVDPDVNAVPNPQ